MNMPIMSAAASMNRREMSRALVTMQIIQGMRMLPMLLMLLKPGIEPRLEIQAPDYLAKGLQLAAFVTNLHLSSFKVWMAMNSTRNISHTCAFSQKLPPQLLGVDPNWPVSSAWAPASPMLFLWRKSPSKLRFSFKPSAKAWPSRPKHQLGITMGAGKE